MKLMVVEANSLEKSARDLEKKLPEYALPIERMQKEIQDLGR